LGGTPSRNKPTHSSRKATIEDIEGDSDDGITIVKKPTKASRNKLTFDSSSRTLTLEAVEENSDNGTTILPKGTKVEDQEPQRQAERDSPKVSNASTALVQRAENGEAECDNSSSEPDEDD
jgi:hypothetical protein